MAREVKCKICGKKLTNETAYKIEIVKYNKKGEEKITRMYYCSEAEYKDYIYKKSVEEQQRKELGELITSFIGETTNTILYKEMQLWGNDTAKIISFLKANENNIGRAMAKDFTSEYAKIRYFSAIIKNGINDYKEPEPEVIKQTNDEFYESKYTPCKRRKCLADYEDGDSE